MCCMGDLLVSQAWIDQADEGMRRLHNDTPQIIESAIKDAIMKTIKVSVITPTFNRWDQLLRCIDIYRNQDYPNKELLICSGGSENYQSMSPGATIYTYGRRQDDGIHHVRQQELNSENWHKSEKSIGFKRNSCCKFATGEIILHMDDDDIYAPDWISKSVAALIESKAAIVGLSNAYFHNTTTDKVYEYESPKGQLFLCGATLCYWRSVWEKKPFKDISKGEDADFITNAGRLHCHGYRDGFLATLHGNNTCSHLSVPAMKKLPQFEAASIINHFYASAG